MNKCKQCGREIISSRPSATARKFCDSTCSVNWKYHHLKGFAARRKKNFKDWRLRNPERAAAIYRKSLKKFRESHPGYFRDYFRAWRLRNPERWAAIMHSYNVRRKRKFIKATKSTM